MADQNLGTNLVHWADQAAKRLIAVKGDKDSYTVASGITPSGVVHIGNFREVITAAFVARAVETIGKKVNFIYSWDDFDTFRKVPANLPQQEMLEQNLRRPITKVPDPYGQTTSYAASNEERFEKELAEVGICPAFRYQSTLYQSGVYAPLIKKALELRAEIRAILDQYRGKPLEESWLPTTVYCQKCFRDEMKSESYEGGTLYSYHCASCDHQESFDFSKTGYLKLNWRTDWPMRWAYEKVDFEPGGKDHSSQGGSFDTAKQIVKAVFGCDEPVYQQYDFVSIKGSTGKMSSSKGELLTVSQALRVYTPEVLRFVFASQRPNHDFAIAFDADVIKVYDEFDRLEQKALSEAQPNDKKWTTARRIYEMSLVDPWQETLEKRLVYPPLRAGFRVLCNRLQMCHKDPQRTYDNFYAAEIVGSDDKKLFFERCQKALGWLEDSAPEEFRYDLNREPYVFELENKQAQSLQKLCEIIAAPDFHKWDPKSLNDRIYTDAIHAVEIDPQDFFRVVYQKLIRRDQGPRLPAFLLELGPNVTLPLLRVEHR